MRSTPGGGGGQRRRQSGILSTFSASAASAESSASASCSHASSGSSTVVGVILYFYGARKVKETRDGRGRRVTAILRKRQKYLASHYGKGGALQTWTTIVEMTRLRPTELRRLPKLALLCLLSVEDSACRHPLGTRGAEVLLSSTTVPTSSSRGCSGAKSRFAVTAKHSISSVQNRVRERMARN